MSSIIRPHLVRVRFRDYDSIRLEDVVELLLQEASRVHLHLVAPDSSQFMDRLRMDYATEDRISLQSMPVSWNLLDPHVTLILTVSGKKPDLSQADEVCTLSNWNRDDVISYLIDQGEGDCQKGLSRLLPIHYEWLGNDCELWEIVLNQLRHTEATVEDILWQRLVAEVKSLRPKNLFGFLGISMKRGSPLLDQLAADQLTFRHIIPGPTDRNLGAVLHKRLLSIPAVNIRLLATYIAIRLTKSDSKPLEFRFSEELCAKIAELLRQDSNIKSLLLNRLMGRLASTSLTLLHAIDPTWKPSRIDSQEVSNAWLSKIRWDGMEVSNSRFSFSKLDLSDWNRSKIKRLRLRSSQVDGSHWNGATISQSEFMQCKFRKSRWEHSQIDSTSWTECQLQDSEWEWAHARTCEWKRCDISGARFEKSEIDNSHVIECDLSNSDLRNSVWHQTSFQRCRWSKCKLEHSKFHRSKLEYADFEGIEIANADFQHTSLRESQWSGSRCESVNFSNANLTNCKLAEIVWVECDLRHSDMRGAVFHYGSTRSGLVGSPYPSHGTRTGFYTDALEELYFKPPESIRRAAIIDCDLRGANLSGIDFYLVDLRGTKLNAEQREQAAASGAILGD